MFCVFLIFPTKKKKKKKEMHTVQYQLSIFEEIVTLLKYESINKTSIAKQLEI